MPGPIRYLELDGLRLAYAEAGPPDAPPVLFLHGWASSLRMWEGAQAALSSRLHTFALDLPGHGSSSKPPWQWYTMATFTQAVRQACQRLGLSSLSLVGHSMGGTIALDLAGGEIPHVARLVLVTPVVTGPFSDWAHPIGETWMRPVVGMTRRVWPIASRLLTRAPGGMRSRWPDHVLRNQEDLGQTTADSALGSIRAVLAWDVRDHLEAIRAPTLVILGDSDRTVSPREGLFAARRIPGAQVVHLAAGHQLSDEAPEAFHSALDSFLDSNDGRRA